MQIKNNFYFFWESLFKIAQNGGDWHFKNVNYDPNKNNNFLFYVHTI